MDLGDFRDDPWPGDALDERYLIDRGEHEAHAQDAEEKPDDEPEERPRTLLDLLFGIDGLVECSINAGIFRANGSDVAADDADEEVSRISDEIRWRWNMAKADHHLMWESHLDNNRSSRKRQHSVLRYATANPGDQSRTRLAEHAREWPIDNTTAPRGAWMSADNWATCPRCAQRAEAKIEARRVEINNAYGKVPVDEFDAMREALIAQEIEMYQMRRTFREDWEIFGAEGGTVTVSYRGGCSVCGLTLEFADNHDIPNWKD